MVWHEIYLNLVIPVLYINFTIKFPQQNSRGPLKIDPLINHEIRMMWGGLKKAKIPSHTTLEAAAAIRRMLDFYFENVISTVT